MPTPYEIKSISKKIYDATQELRRKKNNMNGEISSLSTWWQGAASNAFISKYNTIDGDIGKLVTSLEELENNVSRLSKVLERIEMERKIAASNARK